MNETEQLNAQTITGITFAALGCAVGVASLLVVVVYQDRPVFLMSQKWFMLSYPISVVFLNLYALFWIFENAQQTTPCGVAIYFFMIGGSYGLSSLFCKEFIIWHVYKATLRLVKVDDVRYIFAYVGCNTLIGVALAVIFSMESYRWRTRSSDSHCAVDHSVALRVCIIAFVTINVIATLVIAILARKVPSIAGESGLIFAVTLISFPAFILSMLLSRFASNVMVSTVGLVQSSLIFIFTCVGCWFLVFRRLRWVNLSSQQIREIFLAQTKKQSFARKSSPSYSSRGKSGLGGLHGKTTSSGSGSRIESMTNNPNATSTSVIKFSHDSKTHVQPPPLNDGQKLEAHPETKQPHGEEEIMAMI